jgi:hypothetical protein
MMRECPECLAKYDDARCLTYCPHEEFISEFDAAMKDCAAELLGRPLRFAAEWREGPIHRVQSIGATGQVTLVDFPGEFAPYLFVIAR